MDNSKVEHVNKQEHTHLPHAEQNFANHEQTDVAIRPLVWTLGVLVLVVAVTYAGMAGVFQLFKMMAESESNNPKLSNVDGGTRLVPEGLPALQGVPAAEANPNTPAQDMEEFRKRNDAVMRGELPMRDAKQQPGMRAGMPIERAMEEAMSRQVFKTRATEAGGSGAAGGGGDRGQSKTGPTTRDRKGNAQDAGDRGSGPAGSGGGGSRGAGAGGGAGESR